MSYLADVYERVYGGICGRHPNPLPWHFQWLPSHVTNADLKRVLADCKGRVIDVGCGGKPHEGWIPTDKVVEYTGLDRQPGPRVDIVVDDTLPWLLDAESYDTLICTQVLEHVRDFPGVVGEMTRILKPGGKIVMTLPFLYNAHGLPEDYRRLSVDGVRRQFAEKYEIVELTGQGGAGSTLGILLLNWVETNSNLTMFGRLFKGALLPVWIAFAGFVNLLGWLLDKCDRTRCFYSNVMLVGIKK